MSDRSGARPSEPDPTAGEVRAVTAARAADVARHRTAEATVRVLLDGQPLAGQEVVVSQTGHRFRFGCTGFDFLPLANGEAEGVEAGRLRHLGNQWLGLFNTATLPFYWRWFEPERGTPESGRLLAAARWFAERGVQVKGHPLTWHTLAPAWLLPVPTDEVARLQVERIRREVTQFAGLIDTWDVINEAVIMPIFEAEDNALSRLCHRIGRIPLVRLVFDAAREANPGATLLLNDFDLSAAYECLIEGVLEAGVRIDALGLQSHMHQGYWGEEKTLAIVERFARYGLPIHFTETSIVSGHLMPPHIEDLNDYQVERWPSTPEGEVRQADEIVRHYTALLSHPAVESITYWGLTDDGWLGAPVGFLRPDGTPKPSYRALQDLIRGDWWLPPTTLRTDPGGLVRFTGFLGDYRVEHAGRAGTLTLERVGTHRLETELGPG